MHGRREGYWPPQTSILTGPAMFFFIEPSEKLKWDVNQNKDLERRKRGKDHAVKASVSFTKQFLL